MLKASKQIAIILREFCLSLPASMYLRGTRAGSLNAAMP